MIITKQPHKAAWKGYCNLTGATDRANLLAFIEGVFDLGLWNNLVCWPLRSSQQATSGTTVYSLGGLGSYPGARGGPTPPELISDGANIVGGGQNGVTLGYNFPPITPTTVLIFLSEIPETGCAFAAVGLGEAFNFGAIMFYDFGDSQSLFSVDSRAVASGTSFASYARTSPAMQFAYTCLDGTMNGHTCATNGGIFGGMGGSNTLLSGYPLNLGFGNFVSEPQKQSMGVIFNKALSNAEHADFYALYKSTLGLGLGFP